VFTWAHGDGGPSGELAKDGGFAMYYLSREKKLLSWDSTVKDFVQLNQALWSMADAEANDTSIDPRSVGQYLEDSGVQPQMMGMATAGYANTAGSSLGKRSLAYQCMLER
jgi:hypothetical protein